MDTPVVLIAFNRPQFVAELLGIVRAAMPAKLYLVTDGPRADHPADADLCMAVRHELEQVDWRCEVTRLYNEENRGCEATIELGLDAVFAREERAIILEDDCLPDGTFFAFAAELLDRYADDDRVWHVAGDSHLLTPHMFGADSYGFTTYASIWGWATWSRAWQRHRREFPRDHAGMHGTAGAPARTEDPEPAPGALVSTAALNHYRHIAATLDGEKYGWDSQWWLTVAHHGGLSITPAVNLVSNVGWGPGATHTRSTRAAASITPMPFPLAHPDAVVLDRAVQAEFEFLLLRANGRLSNVARRFVPSIRVRGWIRAVIHNKFVWRAFRAASTARSRMVRRDY